MKRSLPLWLLATALLLSGCAVFKTPTAKQNRRNERAVWGAEKQAADQRREDIINDRAADYRRQGMSEAEAWSAARVEVPGSRKP